MQDNANIRRIYKRLKSKIVELFHIILSKPTKNYYLINKYLKSFCLKNKYGEEIIFLKAKSFSKKNY